MAIGTVGLLTLTACGHTEPTAVTAARTLSSVAAAGAMSDPSAAPSATTAASASSAAGPETDQPAAPGAIDACGLLTAAEITALIGTHSDGTGSAGQCSWENEDTYHSVTVEIGDPQTASGGVLPAPVPGAKTASGPDGIRFSSGNVAEFLIGDRACQVQVVTSVTDDKDRPTAVALIKLIRDRVRS
jgi:hypothetical protein